MSQEKFWTPEEDSRRDFEEQVRDYHDEQAEIAAAAHAKEKAESQRIENVKSHLLRSVDIPQKLGVSFDDIHKWYSDAMQRRNRAALDQDRFESIFAYENYDKSRFAFGSAEKGFLFGDVLNGVFVPSHFAPRTMRGGYEVIRDLGQSPHIPAVMAVTEDLKDTLEKMPSWKVLDFTFIGFFRGQFIPKKIVYNSHPDTEGLLPSLYYLYQDED